MTKNETISLRILAHVTDGLTVIEAMRLVLGVDVTEQVIADLYTQLRAKGGR